MKIVINSCYGGFWLSDDILEKIGGNDPFRHDRADPKLVAAVEEEQQKNGGQNCGDFVDLSVVNIPDDATDWMITDYDGIETVYYVIDGKICSNN